MPDPRKAIVSPCQVIDDTGKVLFTCPKMSQALDKIVMPITAGNTFHACPKIAFREKMLAKKQYNWGEGYPKDWIDALTKPENNPIYDIEKKPDWQNLFTEQYDYYGWLATYEKNKDIQDLKYGLLPNGLPPLPNNLICEGPFRLNVRQSVSDAESYPRQLDIVFYEYMSEDISKLPLGKKYLADVVGDFWRGHPEESTNQSRVDKCRICERYERENIFLKSNSGANGLAAKYYKQPNPDGSRAGGSSGGPGTSNGSSGGDMQNFNQNASSGQQQNNEPVDTSKAPWMEIAKQELAKHIKEGDQTSDTTISNYWSVLGTKQPSSVAWCFDDNVSILTLRGWILFKDLTEDDTVAQVNPTTMELEFVKPTTIIQKDYNGKAFNVKSRHFDFTCDAGHLFYGEVNASKAGKRGYSFTTLDKVSSSFRMPYPHGSSKDSLDVSDTQLQFLAAFISDGFFKYANGKYKEGVEQDPWRIAIQVSRPRKVEKLREFNPACITTASKAYGRSKTPLTTFSYAIPEGFHDVFEEYKQLRWEFIYSLSSRQARVFLDAYKIFDGDGIDGPRGNKLYTSSAENRDRLLAITSIAGYTAAVSSNISRISGKPCWGIVWDSKKKVRSISKKHIHEIMYSGKMYCVEVPSGVILVRDEHTLTPFITGNCSAFANWVMKQVGISGSGYGTASSWKNWGKPLDKPVYGAIIVTKPLTDRGAGTGHVTFYTSTVGDRYACLGGNQSDQVKISNYKISDVVAIRWPA